MDVKEDGKSPVFGAEGKPKAESGSSVKIEAEDPEISKKKFKPEDVAMFETYDDSRPAKQSGGLFGLGKDKKDGKVGQAAGDLAAKSDSKGDKKGFFWKKEKKTDYVDFSAKKKNDFFTPKSNPFDDSIETYDPEKTNKNAAVIAIVVVVGILVVLLLLKGTGVIGYTVKNSSLAGAGNDTAKELSAKQQGIFGFRNIETANLSQDAVKKPASNSCLDDLNNAQTAIADKEGEISQMRDNNDQNYLDMQKLVKYYQDYYQQKIDQQNENLTAAEKELEKAKAKLDKVQAMCYGK